MSGPALLGYCEPLSVAPGDELTLMVSAREAYEVALVRLRHGAEDPRGPGVLETVVDGALAARPGRLQRLPQGSCLRVAPGQALDRASFTVTAWIQPTLAAGGRARAIVARRDAAAGRGWALGLDGDGRLAAWSGAGAEPVAHAEAALPLHRWSFVAASFAADGSVTLVQVPVPEWPVDSWREIVRSSARLGEAHDAAGLDLLVAAWQEADGDAAITAAHFNGRIDRLALHDGAADGAALALADPAALGLPALGRWRPGLDTGAATIADDGPHGLTATVVNTPARGVAGANWDGREVDFRQAREQFDALHFHEDDLTDACWELDVRWTVPDGLRSGVYALRLATVRRGDDGTPAERYDVTFYVRPPRGTTTARAAVLIPTLTYLAYANVHGVTEESGMVPETDHLTPHHRWVAEQTLCSLYDTHRDGSGSYYSSRRRPLVTLQPGFVDPFIDELWCLSADLCLIDWLEHEGFGYDVITDEDLHDDGLALLAGYDVVLTGTHPEYYSEAMLDAHEAYLAGGGRVMYLGGNGYYWVTGISPAEPHVIEIRRGHTGTRTWEAAPGETFLSTTGEPGGLWRHRGRAPQRHVGVGFAAQGGAQGRPYDPADLPADARGAFALQGVDGQIDADGLIGSAAAGSELDRVDDRLGTPPHTVVVGSATGFSDRFQHAIEEVLVANSRQSGSVEPRVRADLAFFEGPNGGAVFSTGSISWSTGLASGGYDNPVARVTGNVLRRFLDPAPLTPQS